MTDPCVQVLSVTKQLDAGVRYLDLRIAHMEEGSERNLHFVHMVYTTALVEVGARGGRQPGTATCGPGRTGWPVTGNTGPPQLEDADPSGGG